LVIHINHDDPVWLANLTQGQGTDFELRAEYHQDSGLAFVRKWTAWSYEPVTQTASAVDAWEFIGEDGLVKERRESAPKRLHCAFRFEMEHLLARTGFELEAVYGDFYRQGLHATSPEMIWVARPRPIDSSR
jgi:hypothetical protein